MQNPPPAGRSLQPLISLRRHGRTSAFVALLVVLLGLPLVWLKGQSFYIAEAVFQVSPSYQKNLSADKELELQSNSQYREFVNHLSRSVVRYDVLENALARLKKAGINPRLPSEDDRKCIERLQRTVYIYAVADTYMVRVGLHSGDPEHLDDIVNAIMDAFLDTTRDEQIFGSDERTRVLLARSNALRSEVSAYEAQRLKLAALLGLTTFGENTPNPYDAILAQLREKLAIASIERSHAQATLDAFVSQRETPLSAGRSVLEMRLQDTGLQALRNEVVKRSEELSRAMAGVEARHPVREPAAAEQEDINSRLQARESAFEKSAQQNVRARLQASLMQTQMVERDLSQKLHEVQGQTMAFAANFREAMQITSEIKKREQELDDMRARLNYLGTESNAIGFVRLISRALPAITPQGPGKTRLLLVLLVVAMGLGLVLPMVIDMLDRRVLTVGDAERAMHIASAAWLVEVTDTPTRLLARDQFRRFASTLLRNRSRGAKGVFGFSSVKVGGGSTAVVLELACTLQQLGSRVLVVDANSLSPHSPMAFDGMGLSEVLAGRARPQEVIQQQRHLNETLLVVPFGQARETGIQRLDVLRSAIDHWSLDHDIVLVDIPPLLPSSDAELLIDGLGQVFLLAEANAVTKGEVSRARALLEKLAPEAVGLVVNKVSVDAAGPGIKSQIVETITRRRFESFMTMSDLRLQLEVIKLRLQRLCSRQPRG